MVATLETWQEVALVTIAAKSGGEIQFAALTETVDIDAGDKDFEGIPTVSGGRIPKWTPEADTSIKLELYPLGIATDQDTDLGLSQHFHTLRTSWDVAQPLSVSNNRNRDNHRIILCWTSDTAMTNAAAQNAVGTLAYRYRMQNAYLVSWKPSFTDKILKFTATFKAPAFAKDGTSNIVEESADGSGAVQLPAVAAY